MPMLSANSTARDKLPLLKIDLVHSDDNHNVVALPRSDSDVSLSVCIQDIPASPTQHAEYTLALTPNRLRKKYRSRKQAVIDIHACFDVNDINGAITVVDDKEALAHPVTDKHCKRYERDSIDLLERYDQLHPDKALDLTIEIASLTSPHQQIPHVTRVTLLEHSCSR